MNLPADDQRPAYLLVAADLRGQIEAGKLKPGQRLPAGREMARRYGVALMTVQNAIRVLREQGFVASQQGRGVFIRERPAEDQPPSADTGHTADFETVMRQIEAVHEEVRRLGERMAELEELVHHDAPSCPPHH